MTIGEFVVGERVRIVLYGWEYDAEILSEHCSVWAGSGFLSPENGWVYIEVNGLTPMVVRCFAKLF